MTKRPFGPELQRTFFVVAFWVHDMPDVRRKALTVSAILGFDLACLVLFIGVLGWI